MSLAKAPPLQSRILGKSHFDRGSCALTYPWGGSVLQKGVHAEVEISLRAPTQSSSTRAPVIPLEPAHINKEMGRILMRRGGETVAAGKSSAVPTGVHSDLVFVGCGRCRHCYHCLSQSLLLLRASRSLGEKLMC